MKDLKLSLIIQALDKATAPLRKIGSSLQALEGRVGRLKNAFAKFGKIDILGGAALIGGATAAATGIWELTNRTAEFGEQMLHGAKKAGMAVGEFQRLRYAARQLGADGDNLDQVFFRFQVHLANGIAGQKQTVKALHLLHISVKDAKKLSADPAEAFKRLVDGFTRIKNPTTRAALAMALFSRSGYQMMPVLTAGRARIEAFERQLDEMHGVLGKDDVEAAEIFIQKKRGMMAALDALTHRIGNALIPAMTTMIGKLQDWVVHLKPAAIAHFTAALQGMITRLPQLLPKFERMAELAFRVADRLLTLASNANVVKGAIAVLAVFLGAQFVVAIAGAATALLTIIPIIWTFAAGVIAATWPILAIIAVVALLAGGVYLLITHWSAVTGFFKGLWTKVGQIFAAAFKWIRDSTPIGWLYQRWGGIVDFFKGLFAKVENVFSDAWKRIADLTPGWMKTILKLGAIGGAMAFSPAMAMEMAAAQAAPVAPAHAAAPHGRQRVDVHMHVTSDGRTQVKNVSAGPGATATVHRGTIPG